MIEVYRKGINMTGLMTQCQVDRNLSAAGSQATLTAVCAPGDYYIPKINPELGEAVRIDWDGQPLFEGTVERVSFASDGLSVSLVCFDAASRLAKNELYGVFSGRPDAIATKVLGALALTPGQLWAPPERMFIPAGCAMSAHQIIRQAYGGRCALVCTGETVDILEPGARSVTLSSDALLAGTAVLSAEGVVNRAEIIGYKGRKDACGQNADSIAAFGLRQKVFSLQGARSTASRQAAGHLSGPSRQAEITLLGGSAVQCGDSLTLGWAEYGLGGTWQVSRVCHQIAAGVMTTRLSLEEVL